MSRQGTDVLRFAVLGDSLAYGVGRAAGEQAMAVRLAEHLTEAGYDVDLTVTAVPGARSAQLHRQVPRAVRQRPHLALVVIGANDVGRVDLSAAAAALGEAVTDLRQAGVEVVVATAPDMSVVARIPEAFRPLVRQASAALASAQAAATVAAGGVPVDLTPALCSRFAADPSLFSADRFHPSGAGQRLIADALAPYVVDAAHRAVPPSPNEAPGARLPG